MSEQIAAQGLDSLVLSDIAHVEMGQSPDSRYVVEDPSAGLPFLQGNAEFGAVNPEPKFGCLRPVKTCKANDVLISVRAPVGAVNLADRDYCIGRGLAAIRGRGIKPSLLSEVVARQSSALRRVAQGTTFEAISKNDLLTLKLSLPPRTDWPKIAQVLDTLDTAIHETEAIIAKLKAVKQGLLHDLLTRGIDANGELRPLQSEAPHLYKPSPLGWIPKEWDYGRLAEKLGVFGGKRLPAGHAYADRPTAFKYLRVTDFFERDYRLDELENLHERTFKALERYEIRSGQLFISIAGSLGYVGVHRADESEGVRTILTENAARLVPLCELVPEFVAAYMNSNRVQSQVTAEKGTGGGVPKLALFRIEQFWLAWPDKNEQEQIAMRIRAVNDRVQRDVQSLQKLRLEKAGLMDDLLTGRVRVTPLLQEAQHA